MNVVFQHARRHGFLHLRERIVGAQITRNSSSQQIWLVSPPSLAGAFDQAEIDGVLCNPILDALGIGDDEPRPNLRIDGVEFAQHLGQHEFGNGRTGPTSSGPRISPVISERRISSSSDRAEDFFSKGHHQSPAGVSEMLPCRRSNRRALYCSSVA